MSWGGDAQSISSKNIVFPETFALIRIISCYAFKIAFYIWGFHWPRLPLGCYMYVNCCLRSSLSVNHRVVLFSHLAQHMASLADAWGSYISLLTQLVLLVTLAPNIHLKLMIQLAHLACVFSCCCKKKKKILIKTLFLSWMFRQCIYCF